MSKRVDDDYTVMWLNRACGEASSSRIDVNQTSSRRPKIWDGEKIRRAEDKYRDLEARSNREEKKKRREMNELPSNIAPNAIIAASFMRQFELEIFYGGDGNNHRF
jgi:hypothetical protein